MGNEALFRDKPIWNAILTLAVPAVLTILIMVVYNIADMFFIGMLGDDDQVAAVAVVGPVFSLATAVATTVGAGGCAVIAKTLGAQERDKASKLSDLCIWATILFGVVFTLLLLTATRPILHLLGAAETLMGYAGTYMRVLAAGSTFMLFSVAMASVIRAEGAVIPGMLSNIAGTIVNLVLDPVFILVLGWGVGGAAAATVLGNMTSSVMLAAYIRKKSRIIRLLPRVTGKDIAFLSHILAVGLPNGISSVLSGLASTFSNRLLSQYGTGAIAAMAAAGRAVLVLTMVQMGICMGVSPLLAYNYGAKNLSRLRETLQKTTILTVSFGLIASVGCFLGRGALVGLFLQDADNLALGSRLMIWLILAGPVLGLYYLGSNFLQAAGNALHATGVSVLRQGALLIPLLYLLHAMLGLTGIAVAHTVSDFSSAGIAVALCLRQYRRLLAETAAVGKRAE